MVNIFDFPQRLYHKDATIPSISIPKREDSWRRAHANGVAIRALSGV